MGKKMPGLTKRGNIWYINKKIDGQRIYESTGADRLEEAEKYLAHRIETIRQAKIYGVRPKRCFRDAAIKYLQENQHKESISSDASRLKQLDPYIGDLPLDSIHKGSLQKYIDARKKAGRKMRTINHGLQIVGQILTLAAEEWKDEYGLTWLASAPRIKPLPEHDTRKPYPLNWMEQEVFFNKLPLYLKRMALFKVNTGLRDQEVCKLRWEWEYFIPELNTSVFIIPSQYTKNKQDRLVVLNMIAKKVIEEVRGEHETYVFTCARWGRRIVEAHDEQFSNKAIRKPIYQMNNNSWQNAQDVTGIPVRVHDLKHTFGRRLRAAGVSFEDRQDLLGHKSTRVTTHYSAAELQNLLDAANKVCVGGDNISRPTLTLLRVADMPKPQANANPNVIHLHETLVQQSVNSLKQKKAESDTLTSNLLPVLQHQAEPSRAKVASQLLNV
jgi:integrase